MRHFYFNFNSKMVRLIVNFKISTIAFITNFNSKMVRLIALIRINGGLISFISIPKWFD